MDIFGAVGRKRAFENLTKSVAQTRRDSMPRQSQIAVAKSGKETSSSDSESDGEKAEPLDSMQSLVSSYRRPRKQDKAFKKQQPYSTDQAPEGQSQSQQQQDNFLK